MDSYALPFTARPLTRQERQRDDLYAFRSPKHHQIITLVGVMRLAFWLEHEFDPRTTACVARPRGLELYAGHEVELDFWTRSQDGAETFWVAVGASEAQVTQAGATIKDRPRWEAAAQRAGLSLAYIHEHDLQKRSQSVANYLRLLPYVQSARRHLNVPVITARIQELFQANAFALSFQQLELSLDAFPPHEVRMAGAALIHAGWLDFPRDLPLSIRTPLQRSH